VTGTARDVTPLERELVTLARKTCAAPAMLSLADLDRLRELAGPAGAIEYAVVAGAFHFVNRIADLLDVDPEALPERLRRFEPLRRFMVLLAARFMKRIDLANRHYERSYDEALGRFVAATSRARDESIASALQLLRAAPQVLEILQLAVEERDRRSTLTRATLVAVQRAVEAALPRSAEETEGFHERPEDPVAAFAFVGTRYPARTTQGMIDRLRDAGYDDLGILDLAIAVADANQWARIHRLLGLDARLFYLS